MKLFINIQTYNRSLYTFFIDAFKKTEEHFKHVDILINNAGIMNDAIWGKEVDIIVVNSQLNDMFNLSRAQLEISNRNYTFFVDISLFLFY